MEQAQNLLKQLNSEYTALHTKFEELFWLFKMGDHSLEKDQNEAEMSRDNFRSDNHNLERVKDVLAMDGLSDDERRRLSIWENFFNLYQTPPELKSLREKISSLESEVAKKLATRKEGYIDPGTNQFVESSKGKMRMIMRTNPDEAIRKACFDSLEKSSLDAVGEYVELVSMRNEFARALGHDDFYAYKLRISEGMAKNEVFDIFDKVYKETKYAFDDIRKLEASKPDLRKPWNFSFMMTGSFTLEEDPYYDFDEALIRWGKSFAALGISYRGGKLQLDLLDRKGKYNNGFCHYPAIVNFNDGRRNPGAANFTCNLVYGQPGSGFQGAHTLFHEAAHAGDRLCSEQIDTCLNTEWPPASVAWAETHSQFCDTMFSSIEWRIRYAKDKDGKSYPFDLFERKARQIRILAPLGLNSIMMVSEFERRVYEESNLNEEKVISIAKEVSRKYTDYSEDSNWILSVPHIYDWESSAYYHSYGLAILALEQWRKYFYDKYGHIVDNPMVGKEMTAVWELGSSKTFPEFVEMSTGHKLSPDALLDNITMDTETYILRAKERIQKMEAVPEFNKPINLDAFITMVHGKEVIANNSMSFEDMAEKYKGWLHTQEKHS
jgi:hypothetical protein